jgi:hypothetical protein
MAPRPGKAFAVMTKILFYSVLVGSEKEITEMSASG